jgi:DNA-binding XRE family transcriptional regulator
MDTDEIKERIMEFLRNENKSSAAFAQEIGVQPSAISHIVSGRNKPSLEFVLKMLNKYPYISTEWLLFGKGSMYTAKPVKDLFSQELSDSVKPDQGEIKGSPTSEGIFSIEQTVSKGKPGKISSEELKNRKLKKTNRIIIIYDDSTFSEHLPDSE